MTEKNASAATLPAPHGTEPSDGYLEAVGKYLVIRRKAVPEKSEGGVILPETARGKMEPEYIGTVVSIGPDVPEGRYVIADRLVYSHNFPMAIPGEKNFVYAFVHADNIMGKVHADDVTIQGTPRTSGLRRPEDDQRS